MKKIKKTDIAGLLNQWQKEFNVLVPSRESGVAEMGAWDGKDTTFLDWYRNTVIPPKASFLLNIEKMFSFSKDGGDYRLEPPAPSEQRQLIFGIRPCDAKALAMLDMLFEDSYEDTYYLSKRKRS